MARSKSYSFGDAFTVLAYALIAVTFLTTSYRRFVIDAQDPYKCEALKSDGQWLDAPQANGSRIPFKNWQAPGCLLHQYKPADVATCVGKQKIVFAGDSTVRQVYWATARKLNATKAAQAEVESGKHTSQLNDFNGITLEFLWDPFLNGTETFEALRSYRDAKTGAGPKEKSPALMLLGTGAWFARWWDGADSLQKYQAALDNVTQYTAFDQTLSQTLSASQSAELGEQAFIQPIQIPVYDKLEGARKATVARGEVEAMNVYLEKATSKANVVWAYLAMTGDDAINALDPTGFHSLESIADAKAEVLLNLRCNAKLDKTDGYPFDRTCCSNYRPAVWTQGAALLAGAVVSGLALWGAYADHQNPTRDAFFFAAATLLYCYIADRTHVFDHGKKYYSDTEFFLLSGITVLAGILSIRRSGKPNANGVIKDQPFLSRDQTEEWKGWMQFAILIYHWTGASSVLPIYQVIRLMVSSYLFQTGFGHTCYFLKKGDFSFKRAAGVLVRLNLLSCALPYVMGTDYLFYYFAPLVTFWFGIVWLTMRVYASRNTSTAFVLAKIFIAAALVTVLLWLPAFDLLFGVLRTFCRITWDVHEWKFRLGLDRYIVFVGMAVAVLFERYNDLVSAGSLPQSFNYLRVVAIIASILALPAAQTIYRSFESKQTSNAIQPYLAAVPILAFVVLRNATSSIRNFHSTIFAWLGKCSLETFTLQFHIWLAADTKGLLTLGIFRGDGSLLGDRWRDFVVLTPLFFWISWRLAGATGVITAFLLKETRNTGDEPEEGLLEKGTAGTKRNCWAKVGGWLWPNDLRLRMCMLLVGMWIMNMTW